MKNKIIIGILLMCSYNYLNAQNLSGFKCRNDSIGDNEFTKYMYSQLRYPDDSPNQKDFGSLLFALFKITREGKLDTICILNNNNTIFSIQFMKDMKRMNIYDKWKKGEDRSLIIPIMYVSNYFEDTNSPIAVSVWDIRFLKNKFSSILGIFMPPIVVEGYKPTIDYLTPPPKSK